jgi:hypothetical protein
MALQTIALTLETVLVFSPAVLCARTPRDPGSLDTSRSAPVTAKAMSHARLRFQVTFKLNLLIASVGAYKVTIRW